MIHTDRNLIDLIINTNDREAGEILVNRYYKMVYKIIYLKVNDEELSLDLTQEVFISVIKNLCQYKDEKASFKTWITRIAEHKVIDYRRSRAYHEQLLTDILENYDKEDKDNVENTVVDKLVTEDISTYINNYGENIRKIIEMKVYQGYTFEEIGRVIGVESCVVKNQYYTTLKKLRKEVKRVE